MGHDIEQQGGEFIVWKKDFPEALAAVRALQGQETCSTIPPHFSLCRYAKDWLQVDNFPDMMREWRWQPKLDEDGNIIAITFRGESLGDENLLFNVIAPYVVPESCIDMSGEDGDEWFWLFDGQACTEWHTSSDL